MSVPLADLPSLAQKTDFQWLETATPTNLSIHRKPTSPLLIIKRKKENHGNAALHGIYFYELKYFIFKNRFLIYDAGTDDRYRPFKDNQYSVEWNKDETKCIIRWEFGGFEEHWRSQVITFN